GLEAAVVVVQPVDHERGAEVGRLGIQVRLTISGAHVVDVRTTDIVQVLRGDVALEHVLEIRRQTEMDVEEVRHVGDVVDDVPAVTVQHLDVAIGVGEDNKHRAENLDSVWLAVQVILHRAKAVPASRVPVRQRAGVDLAYACGFGGHQGPPNLCSLTRTRYSF